MYFNAGDDCDHIIGAHSIQRQQMLEAIEEDSHVYRFKGTEFKKVGAKKVATVFKGFCQKHDSNLFELIDRNVLFPDLKQCLLYSFRSLCRELFISTCDNYAIAPMWYDSQTKINQEKILNKAVEVAHPLFDENKDYLMNDLSGIVDWHFEQIFEL